MSVYLSTDRSGGPEHGKRIGAGHDPDVAGELFMVDTPLRATPGADRPRSPSVWAGSADSAADELAAGEAMVCDVDDELAGA